MHINGGLLALGNVIVALSGGHEDGPEGPEGDKAALLTTGGSGARSAAKKHIPYRWARYDVSRRNACSSACARAHEFKTCSGNLLCPAAAQWLWLTGGISQQMMPPLPSLVT